MWILFSALLTGRPPGEAADPGEEEIQALVEAARSGDDGAAQRLYGLLVARVFRTVRPLCVSEAEAEDVTQETFVRVLGALGSYRRQPGVRFLSWVLTIGLNLARNRTRRRRAEPTEPAVLDRMREPSAGVPSPELADERRRQVAALLAAMQTLSERDRQVVSLRYGAGLEAPEVASLLGLTAPNVRKISERARARLLAQLGLSPQDPAAEEGAHP
jgi:RNA polymerase sigma-70 factor (ECF subfamily)